ncbi:Stp1/IreP family PP2C-type Ser/Thr phosphatase [Boudabousia marimammalium]|uniref:Serine/threonine protein phosphatase PstP n=1 Tax=Boudabousia marimammalium TaxID=156892 RepID=A0A1Q5PSX0_9ACTO|nr:Stp1/IreP family PP2C-type Ser/Thr phosphatase [Boudabousia marimammalium]OKL50545.1 serine/threonine protein phosphatase [Boudabousia marimammalium]
MPIELRYAARSDVGLVRKQNQDSGYAGQHLLVLADGMGGPAGGDIASSVAVAHLSALDQDAFAAEELLPNLKQAIQAAHDELVARSQADTELEGLGTTCIAMLRSGRKLAMVHIGDSRAYVLNGGVLTQVTKDHSFVQYLVDTGQITEEQAEHHPQKSVILRVLGDSESDVVPDESLREAVPGDRWLLCSDGLHGVVSKETITEVLTTFKNLDECADKLVELALRGGGPDNVTVVVADVVSQVSDVPQNIPQIVGSAATDRLKKTTDETSSASRAAALTANSTQLEDPQGEEAKENHQPRKRRKLWRGLLAAVLVLAALTGAGVAAYQWVSSQYYAILDDESIVIYNGLPQQIGPWVLASEVEVRHDDRIADLLPATKNRLKEPVRRDSLQALDEYLDNLFETDFQQRLEAKMEEDRAKSFTPETLTTPESTPSAPAPKQE